MWKTAQAINYEQVDPVDQGRTLGFVNNFLVETVEFLNRFSAVCDKRLHDVSSSLQRLEVTMAILESKLTSIPGLENVDSTTVIEAPASQPAPQASTSEPAGGPPPPPPPPGAAADDVEEEAPPAPAVDENVMTNREDPRYEKYFKMLRLGVPEPSVQQKMMAEGFDPSILSYVD